MLKTRLVVTQGELCKTDLQRECVNKGERSSGGHKTLPDIRPSVGNCAKEQHGFAFVPALPVSFLEEYC